ncbi:MAG: RDD family protein [Alicyclobacillus sp.]|nr:RDD family protein [Alicyclobacillus sp.]
MDEFRCPACHRPVTASMSFCVHCGQKLRATSEPHVGPTQPPLMVIAGHGATHPRGTLRYAGFWRRFAAYLIDTVILGILQFIFEMGTFAAVVAAFARQNPNFWSSFSGALASDTELQDATALAAFITLSVAWTAVGIIGPWIYYAVFESSPWQATLGKRALGIRVCDMEGRRLSFGRATGRYFAKIISALVLWIGYLMAGWTKRKQALHDMIAECLVVVDDKR